jgi:hypothetical protein
MQVHNGILSPSPLVEIADNNIWWARQCILGKCAKSRTYKFK